MLYLFWYPDIAQVIKTKKYPDIAQVIKTKKGPFYLLIIFDNFHGILEDTNLFHIFYHVLIEFLM